MKDAYRVPGGVRLARLVLRPLFRGLFHILSPVKISGLENVPRRQPYIVAVNHVSLYDPPFAVAFWPETLEVMGAIDVWEKPGQNVLVRLYGGIPVHRGDYDRALMDTVLRVLHSGRPLLIAPEGGRSHVTAMRRAKPGVAFILERVQIPVVPVGIVARRQARQRNADLVMSHIAGLLPQAYRGVYATSAVIPSAAESDNGWLDSKAIPSL
jgi:1-acyl-sn-glycerol-3-phosphate acyltransferase